jgi:hypothetical protein
LKIQHFGVQGVRFRLSEVLSFQWPALAVSLLEQFWSKVAQRAGAMVHGSRQPAAFFW